jgi:hypothetical protein
MGEYEYGASFVAHVLSKFMRVNARMLLFDAVNAKFIRSFEAFEHTTLPTQKKTVTEHFASY